MAVLDLYNLDELTQSQLAVATISFLPRYHNHDALEVSHESHISVNEID